MFSISKVFHNSGRTISDDLILSTASMLNARSHETNYKIAAYVLVLQTLDGDQSEECTEKYKKLVKDFIKQNKNENEHPFYMDALRHDVFAVSQWLSTWRFPMTYRLPLKICNPSEEDLINYLKQNLY
jgi:hypothetical protein